MKHLIDQYIKAHENAWAPTTLKSEASRLKAASRFFDWEPDAAYKEMRELNKGAYTIRTAFIRISDFYNWAMDEGLVPAPNKWRRFMNHNARLFKNVYEKEEVNVTAEEAKKLLTQVSHPEARAAGEILLASGARSSEICNWDGGRTVTGKGNRDRTLYLPRGLQQQVARTGAPSISYSKLYSELKKVGLKPHTLRKLAATKFVELGADEATLLKIMGWTSIQTAISYLQPKKDNKIRALVEEAFDDAGE